MFSFPRETWEIHSYCIMQNFLHNVQKSGDSHHLARCRAGNGRIENMRNRHLLAMTSVFAIASLTAPASAQEQGTEESSAQNTNAGGLGDVIVVTANRREENFLETPAVVSVLSEETLEDMRVDSLDSVTGLVPGLTLDGNHRDQNRIGLRGAFSSADTPSSGQAVGLYVDGVYYGRSASLGPVLFDIERVEVLRGPQGTLYGPNVVGGLINIQTRDPSLYDVEGKVAATIANYGYREFSGRISVPVVEGSLGISLSATKTDSNGWVTNLATGNKLNQIDTFGLRGKVLWTPADAVRVEGFVEYWKDDTYGEIRHLVPIDGSPDRFDVPDDWEETLIARDAFYDRDVFTAGLSATFDISENVTLTSITSYHETDSLLSNGPFIAGPVEEISASRDNKVKTFTQEILLSGEAGRLLWQIGGYFYDDTSSTPETFLSTQVPGTPIVEFGYPLSFESTHFMENDTKSISGFGQITFELTDELSVIAGLRYTDESKDSFVQTSGDAFPGNYAIEEIFTLTQSQSWSEFTPKFGLDYLRRDLPFFDSLLFYASATKGFKSGDFVKQTTRDSSIGTTDPEFAWNYEGGFKTLFADSKVSLNATYFYTDYSNLQSQVISDTGFTNIVNNDAVAQGVEAELTVAPGGGLRLAATYGYLDTEISSDDPALDGNRLPRSPKNSFSFSGGYDFAIGDFDLSFLGVYTYQSTTFVDVENTDPPEIVDLTSQNYLNLNFSIRRGPIELALWAKNVLEDQVVQEGNDLNGIWSYTNDEFFGAGKELFYSVKYGSPRTFGATLSAEF